MSKRRILIAPASYKGTLSAIAAAESMREVLAAHFPGEVELDVCPIADGGDDTLAVLRQSDAGFQSLTAEVTGPLPEMRVRAEYLVHAGKKLVVLEAAQAHGLKLLHPDRFAPMAASSFGVGELLNQAASHQPETIVVTLGGSASTDAGLGALQALGVRFINRDGKPVTTPMGGELLGRVVRIENTGAWRFPGRILIATDVINPLLGAEGTARVFAPQKGATTRQCAELEAALIDASQRMREAFGADYAILPGMGAAGGLAYGLRHLPRTGIVSGSQWVAAQQNLDARVQAADVVITGEGCLDLTSLGGKATGHLLERSAGKPVFFLCGQLRDALPLPDGVAVRPLAKDAAGLAGAVNQPAETLRARLASLLPELEAALK